MGIAYGLSVSKMDLDQMKEYRKNYRESRAYRAYLAKNPQHEAMLSDQIMKLTNWKLYEKNQAQFLAEKRQERFETL